MSVCNCGAKHTEQSNTHSDWCDALKGFSESLLEEYGTLKFKRVSDSKIEIIYKPEKRRIATVSYRYSMSNGKFCTGIMDIDPGYTDWRRTLVECIRFLENSINDDRIKEWKKYTEKARKEASETPPAIPF